MRRLLMLGTIFVVTVLSLLWISVPAVAAEQTIQLTSDPDCVSSGSNRIDCFARAADNAIWHTGWNGSSWSLWYSLGGVFTSGPSASTWGHYRIDVFAKGTDNALWHTWFDGSRWAAWENSAGGVIASDPDCVSWGPNRIDCFVRGTDNAVWHTAWTGTNWSGWESLGGVVKSGPGAASWGVNRLNVFARGTDDRLWHTWWDGSHWGAWENPTQGTIASDPDCVSPGPNKIHCFVKRADNTVCDHGWDGTSWYEFHVGGPGMDVKSGPTVASRGVDGLDVFAVRQDNGLWHNVWGLGGNVLWEPIPMTSTTTTTTAPPSWLRCLIATATYGSELAPEVQLLRSFRDNSIMKTQAGSNFMVAFDAWYYSFSSYFADYLANHWVERTIMKGVLYPLIGIMKLSSGVYSVASSYPELAALLSGLVASSMIGAFYLGLPLSLLGAKIRGLRGSRAQRLFDKLLAVLLLMGLGALFLGEVFASSIMLMMSSAAVVLCTLLLSGSVTSKEIAKAVQDQHQPVSHTTQGTKTTTG